MKLTTKTNIENKTKRVSKSVSRTKKRKVIKPYKINVYAKNMIYMNNIYMNKIYMNKNNTNNSNDKSTYDENKDKHKILLSQLTEALGENQWLKYSKDKYKPIQHIDKNKINTKHYSNYINDKPNGSYYSKGSWLFHQDNCCELDHEIIFIEVDYKTIKCITGKDPYKSPIKNSIYKNTFLNFMDKYGVDNIMKDSCLPSCFDYDTKDECNKPNTSCRWKAYKDKDNKSTKGKCIETTSCRQFTTPKKCNNNKDYNCIFVEGYKLVHWGKLYKNYNGFAIYPYPENEMLNKLKKNSFIYKLYDVETLVLWDHAPVIKHHNLGTIREILKETGLTDKDIKDKYKDVKDKYDTFNYFYKYFIPKLIEKINKINNK